MSEPEIDNIYIVEVKRPDAAYTIVRVAAASSAAAKAFVARNMITARRASMREVLSMRLEDVIVAEPAPAQAELIQEG